MYLVLGLVINISKLFHYKVIILYYSSLHTINCKHQNKGTAKLYSQDISRNLRSIAEINLLKN